MSGRVWSDQFRSSRSGHIRSGQDRQARSVQDRSVHVRLIRSGHLGKVGPFRSVRL